MKSSHHLTSFSGVARQRDWRKAGLNCVSHHTVSCERSEIQGSGAELMLIPSSNSHFWLHRERKRWWLEVLYRRKRRSSSKGLTDKPRPNWPATFLVRFVYYTGPFQHHSDHGINTLRLHIFFFFFFLMVCFIVIDLWFLMALFSF